MSKQIEYTVRGHWPFPVDMLRHDESRAATEADQAIIDQLSADHAVDRSAFRDVEIKLVTAHRHNTARWESFGWSVPSDTEHAFYKAANQRARERGALRAQALAKLTAAEIDALGLDDCQH